MIDNIKEWSVLICISSIISALIYYILPEGKIKKTAQTIFSVFMITVAATIITDVDLFDIDIDNSDINLYSYELNTDEYIIKQAESKTEKIINDELKSLCTGDYCVSTSWIMDNNRCVLDNVEIIISEADKVFIPKIRSVVGAITGIIPEVKINAAEID